MPKPTDATVRLHGRPVGTLTFDRGGSAFAYEYDPAAEDHDVLGQIFEDDPAAVHRERVGLPSWFANLLPEGALKRQIIREMGGGNIGDYTLLLRLGRYLPGAVTVRADVEPADDIGAESPAGDDSDLRHSLAGFQLKFSVATDKITLPIRGSGGWWIAKLPDRAVRDLPGNEYVTLRWLAAAGYPVPPVHLVQAEHVPTIPAGLLEPTEDVFLVERFDRTPNGPVHVEDFAQIANVAPRFKYGESGATYDSLGIIVAQLTGPDGLRDYVRRLVAMLVVGNTDAHLKNWALVYPDRRVPVLAPVYDFHSLTVYTHYRHQPLALSLNGESMPSRISVEDLQQLAHRCGMEAQWTTDVVTEAVGSLRKAWHDSSRDEIEARYPELATHYGQRLQNLPICSAG
jgi:serine/threonine-protein kinase HipA